MDVNDRFSASLVDNLWCLPEKEKCMAKQEIRNLVQVYYLEKFNFMKMPDFSNNYRSFYACQPEHGIPVENGKYFQSTFRHAALNLNFPLSLNTFNQTKGTQVDKINELL